MSVAESLLKVKSELRRNMNGVASSSMRRAGIEYKLNFGVTIPQLKQIASGFEKDTELAEALWKEDIRECRILAALLYPQEKFLPDMAELWVEQIGYPDLAEVCSMYLFSVMNGASEMAFHWIASESGMIRYCGFLILAHLLKSGRVMSERYVHELRDQAQATIKGNDMICAQVAVTVLNYLDSHDGEG